MYQIIKKRKIWLSFSALLVVLSIIALALWGLKFGIDFTGGSLLEVKFKGSRPAVSDVNSALEKINLGSLIVQSVGDDGMILRFQDVTEAKHQETLEKLRELTSKDKVQASTSTKIATGTKAVVSNVEEVKYDSVGPVTGEELKTKSINAIIIVMIATVLFVAWAFRKVAKPVSSWKYGLAAIFAMFHDVIVVLGVFAVLGKFFNVEINTSFVAAVLTVLGYSVNDTIVVFDRLRENLLKSNENFETTVENSVNQTLTRSINTSLTIVLTLLAILFFGGVSIRSFALALIVGIIVGTYSSIFLASPILVMWEKLSHRE